MYLVHSQYRQLNLGNCLFWLWNCTTNLWVTNLWLIIEQFVQFTKLRNLKKSAHSMMVLSSCEFEKNRKTGKFILEQFLYAANHWQMIWHKNEFHHIFFHCCWKTSNESQNWLSQHITPHRTVNCDANRWFFGKKDHLCDLNHHFCLCESDGSNARVAISVCHEVCFLLLIWFGEKVFRKNYLCTQR